MRSEFLEENQPQDLPLNLMKKWFHFRNQKIGWIPIKITAIKHLKTAGNFTSHLENSDLKRIKY